MSASHAQPSIVNGPLPNPVAADAVRRRRSPSLRHHLLLLACAAMLPALVLAGVEGWDAVQARQNEAQLHMKMLLADSMHDVEQGLSAVTAVAQVLAISPSLASNNLVAFRQVADDVARSRGVDVVLRDASGAQLVATRVPAGAPLPTLPPEDRVARIAISAGHSFVSDIYSSGMSHPYMARVVVPVPAPKGTTAPQSGYAVEVAFGPELVQSWLNAGGLPDSWQVTVIGRNGQIIGHSGVSDNYVGRGSAQDFFGPSDGFNGPWRSNDLDGQPLSGVYARLSDAGWTIAVGAPTRLLGRPLRIMLVWLAGAAVVLVLGGVAATIVMARRVDRSVATLANAARAMGEGLAPDTAALPVRELDFVQTALVTASQDIQARQQIERTLLGELRSGRDLLQAVVDGSNDLIFAQDGQGQLLLANNASAALFGLTHGADAAGRRLEDLLPAGSSAAETLRMAVPASAGPANAGSGYVTLGDGRLFEIAHYPLSGSAAGAGGTVSIARDVTSRVAADSRLQRLQSDLARAGRLSAVAAMGAGLAHELNQPLSAAANFLAVAMRFLNATSPLPHEAALVAEVVAEASAQVLRVGDIVNRLRSFIGHGETEMHSVAIAPLVREAAEAAWRQGAAASAHLHMQLDESLHALADKVSIQQVVANLVRNAAEAIGPSGDAWVVLEPAADGSALISVLDSGPGIDPSSVDRLFDLFSGSGKSDGLGVGLAICRTIVSAHGGWITAANHERGGAAFAFTLPPAPVLPGAYPVDDQQAA